MDTSSIKQINFQASADQSTLKVFRFKASKMLLKKLQNGDSDVSINFAKKLFTAGDSVHKFKLLPCPKALVCQVSHGSSTAQVFGIQATELNVGRKLNSTLATITDPKNPILQASKLSIDVTSSSTLSTSKSIIEHNIQAVEHNADEDLTLAPAVDIETNKSKDPSKRKASDAVVELSQPSKKPHVASPKFVQAPKSNSKLKGPNSKAPAAQKAALKKKLPMPNGLRKAFKNSVNAPALQFVETGPSQSPAGTSASHHQVSSQNANARAITAQGKRPKSKVILPSDLKASRSDTNVSTLQFDETRPSQSLVGTSASHRQACSQSNKAQTITAQGKHPQTKAILPSKLRQIHNQSAHVKSINSVDEVPSQASNQTCPSHKRVPARSSKAKVSQPPKSTAPRKQVSAEDAAPQAPKRTAPPCTKAPVTKRQYVTDVAHSSPSFQAPVAPTPVAAMPTPVPEASNIINSAGAFEQNYEEYLRMHQEVAARKEAIIEFQKQLAAAQMPIEREAVIVNFQHLVDPAATLANEELAEACIKLHNQLLQAIEKQPSA
ncbi:hypothetical protein DSO57_1012287 [Entomophthora muscae]|uniref:Uncharacterized protein n=1 Tax=Entomophthora muscae TaxID=34485 RepID=A0ACC2SIS1_9FUNG|nr:hypothetical protein DSO57_1012287 [Entomophthora muscae]